MKKLIWTDEMIETLRNLYPVETNSYTASVLGISEKSVNKKASELGIGKFAKSKWLERAEYIRCHFYDKSFAEIGKELGISKWSVSRIDMTQTNRQGDIARLFPCSRRADTT